VPTYDKPDSFLADYRALRPHQRELFKDALRKFIADLRAWEEAGMPGKPSFRDSLRVKDIEGRKGVLEMTWDWPDGRATFHYGRPRDPAKVHVVWRRIGTHRILGRRDPRLGQGREKIVTVVVGCHTSRLDIAVCLALAFLPLVRPEPLLLGIPSPWSEVVMRGGSPGDIGVEIDAVDGRNWLAAFEACPDPAFERVVEITHRLTLAFAHDANRIREVDSHPDRPVTAHWLDHTVIQHGPEDIVGDV
jgi:hypothetical protein